MFSRLDLLAVISCLRNEGSCHFDTSVAVFVDIVRIAVQLGEGLFTSVVDARDVCNNRIICVENYALTFHI